MEINFALDLAYDATKWNAENAHEYARHWAAETFGPAFAEPIAHIKSEYYRLAQEGKPEHLDLINYDDSAAEKRMADYKSIYDKAESLKEKIPKRLQDAYYELVMYPIAGSRFMNEKIWYAKRSITIGKQGNLDAKKYRGWSAMAFESIRSITESYNNHFANGKWNGMMSWHPRDLQVFNMPKVLNDAELEDYKLHPEKQADTILPQSIPASDFSNKKDVPNEEITTIEGLGIGGKGITVLPITAPPFNSAKQQEAPYVEYKVQLTKGEHTITLKVLPTQNINSEYGLHYAISINGGEPQVQEFKAGVDGKLWAKNVVNGYASNTTKHHVDKDGTATVRIYLLEPGLVFNKLEVL